jgi:hypothetical protein
MKVYNIRPNYCGDCGRKLRPLSGLSYDVHTGKKIVEVDDKVLTCTSEYCMKMYLKSNDQWVSS